MPDPRCEYTWPDGNRCQHRPHDDNLHWWNSVDEDPPEPPGGPDRLNVERLREALHRADPARYADCYHGLTVSDCGIDAEDIAREYAAALSQSEDPDT